MKSKTKTLMLGLALAFITNALTAQTVAVNFNRKDCNGITQNLFADLNSGKAVIIEYFMTSCAPCPAAGQVLEVMKANLLTQYPGKIKSYSIAFSNTYSCSTVINWVNTYSFTSVPMDSGAAQVAYYGGMGMPTIVILGGGITHSVLGSPYIGFTPSDTTSMANNIRNSLNSLAGIKENKNSIYEFKLFPNPANSEVKISFNLNTPTEVNIEILDLTGRLISCSINEKIPAGNFIKAISTANLAEGIYVIKVNANGSLSQQKLNIIR